MKGLKTKKISMIVTMSKTYQTFQTIWIWITTDGQNTPGMTDSRAEAPRSYIVQIQTGDVHRNRSQLNINPPTTTDTQPITNSHSLVVTRSHTGTTINPPNRLISN